jgi:hypothetical protein
MTSKSKPVLVAALAAVLLRSRALVQTTMRNSWAYTHQERSPRSEHI